jgi:hypothetical protein
MNVPLQIKQITTTTTQVAFSTSFLLGGCVAAGREEETPEPLDVDAGEDAVIEAVQCDGQEAASRAYHAPDAPVVMPLGLEDAPTSLPPSAALSPPREPKEKRSKQTQSKRPAPALDAEEDGQVVYSYEVTTETPAAKSDAKDAAPPAAKAPRKPKKDPVGESFIRPYGGSDSYQAPTTGTRY